MIPPNIWQDNFLTGSTPFAVYPRLLSASNAPIRYGFQITPAQLPRAYTPAGADIFPTGHTKTVAPNTVMDVDRYEQDVAALTPGHVVSDLDADRHRSHFGNGTLYTWTAGPGAQIRQPDGRCELCGHRRRQAAALPAFPTPIPAPTPAFAPLTTFDSAGNVIGGFGFENVITATAHSTYHALQTSLSGTVGHGGPGIQASYTWGKSIDDTSR